MVIEHVGAKGFYSELRAELLFAALDAHKAVVGIRKIGLLGRAEIDSLRIKNAPETRLLMERQRTWLVGQVFTINAIETISTSRGALHGIVIGYIRLAGILDVPHLAFE